MMELESLYQDVILDHNKDPRCYHMMESPTALANGHNILCGDKITVYLDIKNDVINSASFTGEGCAISTASASMMSEALQGMSLSSAKRLFNAVHGLFTKDVEMNYDIGKLEVLKGVKNFPSRVKCATLAWHTLMAALENSKGCITTE